MRSRESLQRWTTAVAADPENAHIGRFSTFTLRLSDPDSEPVGLTYDHAVLRIADGRMPADLELTGSSSAWDELWSSHGAPRRHDLLALTKAPDGLEVVRGREHLLRHLRVLNRLVELGRGS